MPCRPNRSQAKRALVDGAIDALPEFLRHSFTALWPRDEALRELVTPYINDIVKGIDTADLANPAMRARAARRALSVVAVALRQGLDWLLVPAKFWSLNPAYRPTLTAAALKKTFGDQADELDQRTVFAIDKVMRQRRNPPPEPRRTPATWRARDPDMVFLQYFLGIMNNELIELQKSANGTKSIDEHEFDIFLPTNDEEPEEWEERKARLLAIMEEALRRSTREDHTEIREWIDAFATGKERDTDTSKRVRKFLKLCRELEHARREKEGEARVAMSRVIDCRTYRRSLELDALITQLIRRRFNPMTRHYTKCAACADWTDGMINESPAARALITAHFLDPRFEKAVKNLRGPQIHLLERIRDELARLDSLILDEWIRNPSVTQLGHKTLTPHRIEFTLLRAILVASAIENRGSL